MPWWTPQLNAVLGTAVVMIGGVLLWGSLTLWLNALLFCGILGFLWSRGPAIQAVWAWSTLLLGIESLAWPVVTMIQVKRSTLQPNDEDMGMILNAVLFGLFSSVFWISFAYGLFKRQSVPAGHIQDTPEESQRRQAGPRSKSRRSLH